MHMHTLWVPLCCHCGVQGKAANGHDRHVALLLLNCKGRSPLLSIVSAMFCISHKFCICRCQSLVDGSVRELYHSAFSGMVSGITPPSALPPCCNILVANAGPFSFFIFLPSTYWLPLLVLTLTQLLQHTTFSQRTQY